MFLNELEEGLILKKVDFIVPPTNNNDINSLLYFYSKELEDPEYEEYLLSLLKKGNKYTVFKSLEVLTNSYKNRKCSEEYWVMFKKCVDSETYEEVNQLLYFLIQILINNIEIGCEYVRDKVANDFDLQDQLIVYLNLRETQYHALIIFWILSFKSTIRLLDLIPLIIKIIEERYREKILRVAYAILSNILPHNYITLSQAHQIIQATEKHMNRKFKDIEFIDDMKLTLKTLKEFVKATSSIDNYLREIFEGRLDESPYHYDDKFWESNLPILLENKIEIMKAMKKYLRSTNKKAICIAANDIHRFLKVMPEIYFVVEKLGLKNDLIELSLSKNENIRFHAVQTLATCIFAEWSC